MRSVVVGTQTEMAEVTSRPLGPLSTSTLDLEDKTGIGPRPTWAKEMRFENLRIVYSFEAFEEIRQYRWRDHLFQNAKTIVGNPVKTKDVYLK